MVIPTQHMMKILAPFCGKGQRLLEVGAASGILSLRLAALFSEAQFFAVEENDNFLAILQDNLIFANLLNYGGRVEYEWARYSRLPIESESVDVVFSFCSLNRWKKPLNSILECHRVCAKDGSVILYDLARDADEGMISFVLQYAGTNHREFMEAMKSSFSVAEMEEMLEGAGLGHWCVVREGINLVISSRPVDTAFTVGDPCIYEGLLAAASIPQ